MLCSTVLRSYLQWALSLLGRRGKNQTHPETKIVVFGGVATPAHDRSSGVTCADAEIQG